MIHFNSRKHSNSDIYDAVTAIETTIQSKRRISFYYFDLNEHAERMYRHDKKLYLLDPVALIFNHDNYCLRGYSPEYDEMLNYRVDRMAEVSSTDQEMDAKANVSKEEITAYTEQVFKMYGGVAVETLLEFKDELLDVIFDKFGEDIHIVRKNENTCIATVVIQINPTF